MTRAGRDDICLGYHEADARHAEALAQALRDEGLGVSLAPARSGDPVALPQDAEAGWAEARALLVWYSRAYAESRACQWQLAAASVAVDATPESAGRLWAVNPEADTGHILPASLLDNSLLAFEDDYASLARHLARGLEDVPGPLGAGLAQAKPTWRGSMHGLGAAVFLDCDAALWALHAALATSRRVRLQGGIGIGKGLLAEEYALRFGAAWPGGVFWLNARGLGDPAAENVALVAARRGAAYVGQLVVLVEEFGGDASDKDVDALREQIGRRLDQAYLWIVDGLGDVDNEEVERWLAPSAAGKTLIVQTGKGLKGYGEAIRLEAMPYEAARALLTHEHAPEVGELADVHGVLDALGGFPLALRIAQAACQAQGYAAFRRQLEFPDAESLKLIARLAPELPEDHSPYIAVSLRAGLRRLSPEGMDALRLAARVAAAPIPVELLGATLVEADGLSEDEASGRAAQGLHQVLDAALARVTGARQYAVHRLVLRAVLGIDPDPARGAVLGEALTRVLRRFLAGQAVDTRRHAHLAPLLRHAQARALDAADPESADLAGRLGRIEYEAGRHASATVWFEVESSALAARLGAEHPETLKSVANLASSLNARGDQTGARALAEMVLEARRRQLGEDHPDTLKSMANLSSTLKAQGDYAGAQALEEQALDIQTRVLGEEHADTLTCLANLAGTLRAQGDLGGSRALTERILSVRRRVLGEEHPETLKTMTALAAALKAQGDLATARELEERIVVASFRSLGEDHPDTLASRASLVDTLWRAGDLASARILGNQVMEARREVLGASHPDTLKSMAEQAVMLKAQGYLAGARALEETVLEARRDSLGEAHPETLKSMTQLATTLWNQGYIEAARALEERILELRARALGASHPDTTVSAWTLFSSLLRGEAGDMSKAAQVYERYLSGLLAQAPETLGTEQRKIREMLVESMREMPDEGLKQLDIGASHELSVDPRARFVGTGLKLAAGEHYAFQASGKWRDGLAKTCGPEGWRNRLLARFNRLPGQPFFLLCGCLGRDADGAFGIGAELADWRVPDAAATAQDPELCLFANDWPWMYWNNHDLDESQGGPLRLRITRLA